jgi:hypothetical protein
MALRVEGVVDGGMGGQNHKKQTLAAQSIA